MKIRIENITELDGITLKLGHAYRVGRIGNLLHMDVGYPMGITYSDGHGTLMTSKIVNINEQTKEYTVRTQNSIYVLDKI